LKIKLKKLTSPTKKLPKANGHTNMNKVFVTGATGYIGSHVCKALKQAGYTVVGLDRVPRDHTIKHMDRFIEADYHSPVCFDALAYEKPNAVIHLAGTSLVGPSMADPAEYYVNNVAKTSAFLDTVRWLEHMPVVVFSSSAAVYGNPDAELIYENTSYNPLSPYGQTKAMIEIMLVDYCRAYGLKSASLRYFNACGADADGELGQAPGATHIIARLLESVRDNKEFTLYGDGTHVRDYVHVTDLANAHVMAVQYLLSDMQECVALNLGSEKGFSNQEIVDAVVRRVGPVQIAKADSRPGDPARLVAGILQAKSTLGWSPDHSDLDTIIDTAWKWYNNPSHAIDNLSK
jgi:UDP-glucose-4-epimerase GalE